MRIYLIRHGHPNYKDDCLTPEGHVMAKKLAVSLKDVHFDEIYSSTHGRAVETASYTLKLHNMEPILAPWAREDEGGKYFVFKPDPENRPDYVNWAFYDESTKKLMCSKEIRDLGKEWFKHPYFAKYTFDKGVQQMAEFVDDFMLKQGYKHDRNNNSYISLEKNEKTLAIFAHGGFGQSFLSQLLDIPYPEFVTKFCDMHLTGVTIIDIDPEGNNISPKVISLNDDSHLRYISDDQIKDL